jgi:hypothetical protein
MRLRVSFAVPALLALCAVLTGCIVAPFPAPTKRVGPSGTIKGFQPDSFVVGKTTRDEMAAKLEMADTKISLPHLFWARWSKSTWGLMAGVGGPGAAVGGAGRMWGAENLIAEFDDNNVLKEWKFVHDRRLAPELNRFIPARSETKPTQFAVTHYHKMGFAGAQLVLGDSSIELVEQGKNEKHSVKLAPSEILAVTSGGSADLDHAAHLEIVSVAFQLRTPAAVGNELKVATSIEHLVDILAYMRERAPQAVIK